MPNPVCICVIVQRSRTIVIGIPLGCDDAITQVPLRANSLPTIWIGYFRANNNIQNADAKHGLANIIHIIHMLP